jgi:polysaccharide export outer membrane protein
MMDDPEMTANAASKAIWFFFRFTCVLLIGSVMGCGRSAGVPDGTPLPSADRGPASQYVIGPGDRLQVFVYEAPNLSMSGVPVRPDGRLSLPLVPDLEAAGKTPTELAKVITERLKEFVKEPNVSVIVQGFTGPFDRQIRVIGEATDPMAMAYSDRMTLLDVMIATKGLTRYASGNRAVIVRRMNGHQETIKVRLSDLLKDGDVTQNVDMEPGDTLIIPQTYF